MKVEFWLRTAGNHHKIVELEMETFPREGEAVQLHIGGPVRDVHSVTFMVEGTTCTSVRVLLKDG